MKKIIYILSLGHSGSTLLDITLGQFENTFSTGELKHLTWQYFRVIENWQSKQKCTCGKYFDECKIWSKVIEDLADLRQIKPIDVPMKVPIKHFDSLFYTTNFMKDKILRYIYKNNLFYKAIPKSLFHLYFKIINENNIKLYESIFNALPKVDYIIDSSKDIIRYFELHNNKKINTFPIVLIRDIDEVMNSKWVTRSSRKVKSWQTYYNRYVLSILKTYREEDFHIISYEKFINDPKTVINELGSKIKINTGKFNIKIPMDDYHVVAGGGMRYTDFITIKQKKMDMDKYKLSLLKSNLNQFYIDRI